MVNQQTHWILNHSTSVLTALVFMSVVLQSNTAAATREDEARSAGPSLTPAVDHEQRTAVAMFSEQHPRTRLAKASSRITRIYGRSFGSGLSPEDTARQFKNRHASMFGTAPQNLRPASVLHDTRHTQPLIYDRETGQYRFTLVYYTQHSHGIPVFRADLRLLVRNEPGHPLVLASANLRALGNFAPARMPQASENANLGLESARASKTSLRNFGSPNRVIWAGVGHKTEEPRVAYTFTGDNRGAVGAAQPENWLFVTDAATGKVLYEESLVLDVDVHGNVSGMASQGPGADICEAEVPTPMPYARVNIEATQSFADENGEFVISNGGTGQVTVQSPVRGEFFVVHDASGSDTVLSKTVMPPGPADFMHNAANTSELDRAEVNAYVESNIVRDWILSANPDYPQINAQTGFSVVVNRTDGFCPGNAWYDSSPLSINFCRAGGGYPNTAWSSVVHHEYGHHLVAAGGSGQGAYGEGMGDVMSTLTLDDPRLGLGFFGSCSGSLRHADNTLQYPCEGEAHTCGQLLSGCVWSTRNELVVTEPLTYLQTLRSLSVNSVLLHGGSDITPDITIDWLTLDDDDDDITNGTPHYSEIAAGFGAHNMPAPELVQIEFDYPDGLPAQLVPNESTVIRVDVGAVAGTPVPDSGTVSYRTGGSPFTTAAMDEIYPNEYEATLPGAGCGVSVEFYFGVTATGDLPATDPPDAPNSTFIARVFNGITTTFVDNFESDQGWVVGAPADDATSGVWTRVDPNGTAAQPEDDHSPAPGTLCFVTGQGSPGGTPGANDVDNGRTTLLSPTFDASHAPTRVSYWRWYSNDTGAAPNADVFQVDVSNDDGATWLNAETVGPASAEASGGWFYHEFLVDDLITPTVTMMVRFVASDEGSGSIVEAAVDDFRLDELECEISCLADFDGDGEVGPVDLASLLGAWGSNSSDPADLNGDKQVDAADLAILLGDWGSCP